MGAVKGLLATTDGPSDDLVGEFQESIFVRNSRGYNVGTSLFGLMSRLDNEPAENVEYSWYERDPVRKTVYGSSGVTDTTTLVFKNLTSDATTAATANPWLVPGMVLMRNLQNATTNLFIRINSVGNDVTTPCGITYLSGTATTLVNNDVWTIVTAGKYEGADPSSAVYENQTTIQNYIQTFNSTVELSNAFKNSVLRSDIEGPLTDRRIQAMERISRDIEFAYFLGTKYSSAGTYGKQYFTGGVHDSLVQAGLSSSNIVTGAATGTLAFTTFNTWLQNVMGYGSDVKLAFCGPRAYAAISERANSQSSGYRIMQNETVFGLNIQVINTPFGELNLTQHPLLREAGGVAGDSYGLNSWMFVVDLPMLTQKVFEPLFLEPNIQSNGSDSYKEQFRAKLGLKMKFPQAFGVCKNLLTFT
jgi:hypothetical protein